MGKRTPTTLKLLKGTARPSRLNLQEPKPQPGIPTCPPHVSARAKAAWQPVAKLLLGMGVLTVADGLALEGLTEAYAELQAARQSLAAHDGLTYTLGTKAGGIMHRAYPEVAMVASADKRFQSWLAKFGLTQADRAKVSQSAEGHSDSGWDALG